MKSKKLLGSVLAVLLALPALPALASDGKNLAWKYHCVTCHGERGKSNAARYPHIAGQNAAYIESRLKYFRSYTEPGNQMNAQAAPLSDEEITILADHFSRMSK